MKKVIFIPGWDESPEKVLKRLIRQTPNLSGKWGNIIGTSNIEEADYIILLENFKKDYPDDKVLFVKREPDYISKMKTTYSNKILWSDFNTGAVWWINKTYDELKSIKYPIKTKKASAVVSNKHVHRLEYLKKVIQNKNIDLYGRGHDSNIFGDSYKGPLEYDGNCKYRGIVDYKYSIVLENSSQENYWTEKLSDVFLSWTMPLYWGCPNLDRYFSKESYYYLDFKSQNPELEIKKIINRPLTEKQISAISDARNLILDTYNIWNVICNKINQIDHTKKI